MKRYVHFLGFVGSILAVGLMAIAYGQNESTGLSDDERLMRLERVVTTLESQLQQRTSVVGPDDRITRDFNLDTRLDNIERQVMDLQRQLADAQRIANQAQRDAQMAQQIARNAEARSR